MPTPITDVGTTALPQLADLQHAAKRLAGKAVRTTFITSPALDQRIGGRIFIKPEILQRTGSFKFRGAYNKISAALERNPGLSGVVAFSSGNHAQGVAAAAQLLKVPAIIVMPSDAPAIKVRNTRSYGAEVVLYDRYKEDREAIARDIAARKKYEVVPPYDDPYIMAGQGTIGLEIIEDVRTLQLKPDLVLAPASGGGLISGIAIGVKSAFPDVEIYCCEPAGLDDYARSLAAGQRLGNAPDSRSICDALMSKEPGVITFEVNRRLLKGGVTATDDEVLSAMAYAARNLKLVIEPGGAIALAALLMGRVDAKNKVVVVVCSGGNVDDAMLARALEANPAEN